MCSEVAFGSAAYETTLTLRNEVLRKPLGLDLKNEDLSREHSDHHLVCEDKGEIVACLVLVTISSNELKMRQVAVAPHAQSRGVGRALVQFAEDFARDRGFSKITLHARATAIPFYEKAGYERVGELFQENTIPHLKMQKHL